jgi:hypothetical protein
MNYEALDSEDVDLIEMTQRRIDSTTDIILSDLHALESYVKDYKESMKSMTSSALSETDILLKYSKGHDDTAYNLPGVFASTVSNYDLSEMRNDNKRLKDFQDKHEVLDKKRNQIYSMILSTYRDLKDRLNLIAQDNMAITTSLEEIKAKLD